MAKDFEITAPDGRKFVVTAPEGASREQILKYAQQQLGQQQQAAPAEQAQQQPEKRPTMQGFVPGFTPPPEMMARERIAEQGPLAASKQMSRFGRSTQGIDPVEGDFVRARRAAEAAGVDASNSAPSKGRIALALAAPVARDPVQQVNVLKNALGNDYEVRVGPDTESLEWRQKEQDQWSLANPPGFDLRDIVGAAPETATVATGALAGFGAAGGGFALSGGNPAATGASTVIGVSLGEGTATQARLRAARSLGHIPDITDEEIADEATRRAIEAGLFTVGGGVLTSGFRTLIARRMGASKEVIEALEDVNDVDAAFEQARELQARVTEETGEQLPLTAGQASSSPELKLGEQAARTSGPPDSALVGMQRQQQTVQNLLENRLFGDAATQEDLQLLTDTYRRQAEIDVERYRNALEADLDPVTARAAETPESAAKIARARIETGIRDLYQRDFSPRYTEVFSDSDLINVDLSPLRTEAGDIADKFGQDILRSISLTNQKILREAQEAGLEIQERLVLGPNNALEWEKGLVDSENVNLTQVQNALVDIRRELRRPGISEEPQKKEILGRLKTTLESIRNNSLPPQKRQAVIDLDKQYAEASAAYNKSFVGQFADLAADGTPVVRTDLSFQRILRSPEVSEQFVEAVSNLPNGNAALSQFRRGTVAYILDQARDETGEIVPSKLNRFLTGQNKRALSALFQGDNISDDLLNVQSASRALIERDAQVQRATSFISDLTGVRVTNPAQIAQLTYENLEEITIQEIRQARNFLPESERAVFDSALAREVRNRVLDSNGNVDFTKIDGFLDSRGALAAKEVFGESYISTLRTLRDVARIRAPVTRATADRDINNRVAKIFESSAGFAEGFAKFLRVPLPPLSVRGRALTAGLSQLQERTQKQLAEILAQPEKFNDLRKLLSTDLRTRNFQKIAAGAGLNSFVELSDLVNEAIRLSGIKAEEEE
jgi:hypothetical protein